MINFIKQAFFPIVNMLFCSMLGICITLLEANLIWLKYALFVVLFGFYALVIATALFKEGEMALKTRNENDLFRRKMVETGEEYPLKLAEEYKWWKGIVVGLITATPSGERS